MVKRDLFGTVRLVRNWGQIDTIGQELVEIHADEAPASQALEGIGICDAVGLRVSRPIGNKRCAEGYRQFNELKAKRLPELTDQAALAMPVTSAQT